jgi:hypothetical protein
MIEGSEIYDLIYAEDYRQEMQKDILELYPDAEFTVCIVGDLEYRQKATLINGV